MTSQRSPNTHPESRVLVPVKDFRQAKGRLSEALNREQRAELAQALAARVIAAAMPLGVSVICDDINVANWAESLAAEVLWCPGTGLNGAVAEGVAIMRRREIDRVVVSHADLPAALDFTDLATGPGVIVVTDRRGDGTNVISLPTQPTFSFAYGPGSRARHVSEAQRLGLGIQVRSDARLSWDVDNPEDLRVPTTWSSDPSIGRIPHLRPNAGPLA
ncbi:MAG: 2-phospho-L-lactate guanylyltransferase [Acidimicrobiales bacterium]